MPAGWCGYRRIGLGVTVLPRDAAGNGRVTKTRLTQQGHIRFGLLRHAPRLTIALLTVPVLAGLAGTVIPAFGGQNTAGLTPFQALADWPGLVRAVQLSLFTGVVSTGLSLMITLLIVASLLGSRIFGVIQHVLSPLLAVPHAAAALGLAFLIAPSGWIARALSPWATGWHSPPDLLILNDPAGWALILGLVAKEVPFLLLMTLAALPQTDATRRMMVAASLGYGRVWGFVLSVLPGLYPLLRLPVYAVLTYAMTCVDMAAILGPGLPPTLSVQITHWMMDATLAQRSTAAAGALVQLITVLGALMAWHGAERLLAAALPRLAGLGLRITAADAPLRGLAIGMGAILAGALFAGLGGLALWSLAGLWPFPDALPHLFTLQTWAKSAPDLASTAAVTFGLAAVSTGLSLLLVLGCLEAEHRYALPPNGPGLWLLYLPLLVPQIAFLPGLQSIALHAGPFVTAGSSVAFAHMVFVLPYVFLSLAPAYRAWDKRHGIIGAALGATPNTVFWRLRVPMLLPAVLTAVAVGLSVSVTQYLPTLLIGGGRIETLATQAVALSSGGNRRIIGAYGLLQMLLPAAGFALAIGLPRLIHANRRGMRIGLPA